MLELLLSFTHSLFIIKNKINEVIFPWINNHESKLIKSVFIGYYKSYEEVMSSTEEIIIKTFIKLEIN